MLHVCSRLAAGGAGGGGDLAKAKAASAVVEMAAATEASPRRPHPPRPQHRPPHRPPAVVAKAEAASAVVVMAAATEAATVPRPTPHVRPPHRPPPHRPPPPPLALSAAFFASLLCCARSPSFARQDHRACRPRESRNCLRLPNGGSNAGAAAEELTLDIRRASST